MHCKHRASGVLLLVVLLTHTASLDATPATSSCAVDHPCEHDSSSANLQQHVRALFETQGAKPSSKPSHKALLPTSQYDVAMFIVAGIVLFIAAGAGMGGGPVLVPLYLTLGAFHQQAAVALSNSTILAGSVANVFVNARKRHPFRNRPLVDWDLILLMQPPTLIGAIAGSYINKLLPPWISHLLLALLLTLMTIRVLQRANMIYKKESAARQPQAIDCSATVESGHAATAGDVPAQGLECPAAVPAAPAAVELAEDARQLKAPAGSSNRAMVELAEGDGAVQMVVTGKAVGSAEAAAGHMGGPAVAATAAASAAGVATPDSSSASAGNSSSYSTTAARSGGGMARGSSGKLGAVPLTSPSRQQLQPQRPPAVHAQQLQEPPQQRRTSREAQYSSANRTRDAQPPNEAECRLAYAPPGHTRKGSWELQDDWDQSWELHNAEEDSSQTGLAHFSGNKGAGNRSTAAATGEAPLLNSGRALSAPIDGSMVVAAPTAVQAVVGTADSALQPAKQSLTNSRGRTFSTSVPLSTVADVRAVVHKTSGSLTATSRSDSAFQKLQKSKPKQAPPELAVHSSELQALLTAEAAQLPAVPVLLLFVMFVVVLLTSLFSKKVRCGSVGYWLVQWAVAPVLLAVWWYSRRRVLRKVGLKRAAGLDFHGDIRWTHSNSVIFPAICSLAGVIAGMFGLGGAVVKTPLMLELGVQPQVTAATTQTMLLLTTAASTIVYAQLGDIPWQYAAVLMPMAFAATLAGQFATDWVIKKLGRSSVVVIVLAAFFVVACGLTFYISIDSLIDVAADPVGATVPGRICGGGG